MAAGQSSKVLLAEDDVTMQSVLRTLLELEGFAVAVAPVRKAQEDLLGYIRAEQPDVILLDFYLGDRNGLDLLSQLREDPVTRRTRVIMTSGMDMQHQCLSAGADDFILKPFMPDELIQKLRG